MTWIAVSFSLERAASGIPLRGALSPSAGPPRRGAAENQKRHIPGSCAVLVSCRYGSTT